MEDIPSIDVKTLYTRPPRASAMKVRVSDSRTERKKERERERERERSSIPSLEHRCSLLQTFLSPCGPLEGERMKSERERDRNDENNRERERERWARESDSLLLLVCT